MMDGFGSEASKDGKVYMGTFQNGQKHGEGMMTYSNQKQYRGEWHKNMKHGTGVEINLIIKSQRSGEWRHGTWMRWISGTQKI